MDMLNSANDRINHNIDNKICFYIRGYLYGIIGCTGWAIADLTRAIEQDPQFALAHKERGICCMDLGKYEEALKDLNQAIKLDPHSGDALVARGRLYLILNQPQKALPDLQKCSDEPVSFIPALPGELPGNYFHAPQYYLSWCYRYLGKTALAQEYLDKSAFPADHAKIANTEYIHRWADKPSIR
jgi:tetratricopeptide (TPR) repeat protein